MDIDTDDIILDLSSDDLVRLNEEKRLSAKREASKQTVTSQERIRRGIAPAGEPKGTMLNKGLYFNWRC